MRKWLIISLLCLKSGQIIAQEAADSSIKKVNLYNVTVHDSLGALPNDSLASTLPQNKQAKPLMVVGSIVALTLAIILLYNARSQ